MSEATATRSLLRDAGFRRLVASQAVSVAGSALSPVALALAVLEVSGSQTDLAIVLAAGGVPTFVFLILGGGLSGRVSPLRLAVWCNILAASSQLALGAMFVLGHYSLPAAAALQVVTGAALGGYFPTLLGITARSVPPDRLQETNALLSMVRSLASVLGPASAGIVVATVGAGWAIVGDGLSFAACAWLLSRLPLRADAPSSESSQEESRYLSDLAQGWREVAARSWVWSTFIVFGCAQFMSANLLVLGPGMLLDGGGNGAARWGLTMSAMGLGQFLGDLAAMRLKANRPLLVMRLVGLLSVPLTLALAVETDIAPLIGCAVIAGVAVTVPDTLWFTSLQTELTEPTLTRVSSWDWALSLGLQPVGFAAAGFIGAGLGSPVALALSAVIYLVASGLSLVPRSVRSPIVPSPEVGA